MKITVNTNEEFIPTDKFTMKKFKRLVHGYLKKLGYECQFADIGTTYWWETSDDISDDDGFWVQGILERAWSEARA